LTFLTKYKHFLWALVLFGCNDMNNEHVIGGYYLSTVDYVEDGMSLYYDLDDGNYIGVVNETVFAVGYNEEFIIVKQHPTNYPFPPDKSTTNYYIIPLKFKVNHFPDENKIGPLSEIDFTIKRKELGIPDSLSFTKILMDQE
jgi:hypothetical protein